MRSLGLEGLLPLEVFDGTLSTDKELQCEAWHKYGRFLSGVKEDRIRIKRGYEFRLIAQMIEDGTLPFLALILGFIDRNRKCTFS